ncbi:MAG: hypothetical protein ABJA98_12020 [Acidobacteriota bacterium]
MVSRRTVLHGPAFGGLLAALAPPAEAEASAPAAPQRETEQAIQEGSRALAKAVQDLRDEIKRQDDFWELGPLRDPIKMFLRTTGKFPDYIEVGIDVWQQVYDWHVRYQQPLTIGRNAEGRYTIMLMGTMVVMRVETSLGFVGIPFDNR